MTEIDWVALRGRRALLDEHGVVEFDPDDPPLQFWVCPRRDEPWKWRVLPQQHIGTCEHCGAEVVYRESETDPRTPKICQRCATRLLMGEEAPP